MSLNGSNRILTTTQDKLAPKLVDTVLNSNVFASKMLAQAKPWAGEQYKVPIKVSKNTNGGSFDGFDTFNTSAVDTRRRLAFDPAYYQISVTLPLTEIAGNDVSETKVLNLVSIEMASTAQDAADDIGTMFYGDGTGNEGKDFLGLAALVDDGTNVSTIGGLSRSTFPTLQSTVTDSGGTLSLAKMATLYNDVTSGSHRPTMGVCNDAAFALYESLLEPKLRINKNVGLGIGEGLKGGTGFTGLDYKGMPILQDEKATAQTLFFLNENFIEWRALPVPMGQPVNFMASSIEGNDYSNVKGLGFSWSGFIKSINAAAIVGHIYLGGNLICTNPKRQGKLTGITSV